MTQDFLSRFSFILSNSSEKSKDIPSFTTVQEYILNQLNAEIISYAEYSSPLFEMKDKAKIIFITLEPKNAKAYGFDLDEAKSLGIPYCFDWEDFCKWRDTIRESEKKLDFLEKLN